MKIEEKSVPLDFKSAIHLKVPGAPDFVRSKKKRGIDAFAHK